MDSPTISHTIIATTGDISFGGILFLVITPLVIVAYTFLQMYRYRQTADVLPAKDKRTYKAVQTFTAILACTPLYFLYRYISNFFVAQDFNVGGWLFDGFTILIVFSTAAMCAISLILFACLAYLRNPKQKTSASHLPSAAMTHRREYLLVALLAVVALGAILNPGFLVYSIFCSPFLILGLALAAKAKKLNAKKAAKSDQ